jgi:hypothetical protein
MAFSYGVVSIILGGITLKTILALCLSLMIATIGIICLIQQTTRVIFYATCLQCIALSLTIPTFFFVNGVVVTKLGVALKDEALLNVDESLLGW